MMTLLKRFSDKQKPKAEAAEPHFHPWQTRPFEAKDLRPVPEGWTIGEPDFVGIASGRSGTCWWYQMLLDHPAVKPNRLDVKELSYFYHFGYQGLAPEAMATYRQAFARPSGCICGEWSPGYLAYPLAVDYLARTAPQTKLIATVRNPVDRVISATNRDLAGSAPLLNLTGQRAYIFKTFSLFHRVMANSLLDEPFRHLLNLFDRSQLLVLQYERCKMDPAGEIARTFRFLGVDDSFLPAHLHREPDIIPYVIPKLDPNERAILADYFSDDVHAFAKRFPEIDLSLWGDFAH